MERKMDFSEAVFAAFEKKVLRMLVFSQPMGDAPKKIVGRAKMMGNHPLLVLESSLPGDTVSQKNVPASAFSEVLSPLFDKYRQVNLLTSAGDAEYRISKSGKEVYLGLDKLLNKSENLDESMARAFDAIDKCKNYYLSGKEPFLHALGISDASGRVHDKMQGKFRQINRFLEHIEDLYEKLPKEGELLVYDLCCGKSYLSFAVYHYFTAIKGRTLSMLGIDLKEDVIRYCQKIADESGFSGMTFTAGDITKTPTDRVPDMVVSLHACDVATDIVLNTAIKLGAKVILSTPCCHRYLTGKIAAPELSFITSHGHLSGKLAEAATDALRALRLEASGYAVRVVELTDPTDTPKNTLLRAVKVKSGDEKANAEYEKALRFLLGENADGCLKELNC